MAESNRTARFRTLTFEDLQRFLADRQEENLHLDFKLVTNPSMNRDDRRNLAKTLSGFANSEGGLIIWGVDARKNEDDIDCVCALCPVPNVPLLLSRLNQLTSDMVSPTVPGVAHRIVHKDENAHGYAATVVPASDAGPHMAKGGEDRYYKRSGDSFVKMEHFDVADMFGRRSHPLLTLSGVVYGTGTRGGPHGSTRSFRVVLSIENIGRGSARAPYLAVQVKSPYKIDSYGVDGNYNEGLDRLVSRGDTLIRYGGMGDILIHPGTTRDVLAISGSFNDLAPDLPDLEVTYELTAEGAEVQRDVLRLPGADIVERARTA